MNSEQHLGATVATKERIIKSIRGIVPALTSVLMLSLKPSIAMAVSTTMPATGDAIIPHLASILTLMVGSVSIISAIRTGIKRNRERYSDSEKSEK